MDVASETAKSPTPIAVIDIGSNAIRMAVAQVEPDGQIEVLERMQQAVRLGQDTFVTGRLSAQTMSAVLSVLKDYQRIIDTYGAKRLRAVATSATREAANCDGFVDRIYMAVGLDLEVIDPSEESRLIVSAVREELRGMPEIEQAESLVLEVGGGNALLSVLQNGELSVSESFRLGSIRLREVLGVSDESPTRAADLIRHQIAGILGGIVKTMPMGRISTVVMLGGDARFVAQHGRSLGEGEVHEVDLNVFDRLVERFSVLSPEEIVRRHDMPFADAETLGPALLVYQSLAHATRAEKLLISPVSMRDGLLLDLARTVTGQEDETLARNILHSAEAIGEKYRYDGEHAHNVADLALQFFDGLREEHGLGTREQLLLRVAALLHEVGTYVSGRAHHKHSYYLISNAEIFGLRGEELQIVALLARYHRRSAPRQSHTEYISLPREKRVVVSKLAAILRVADALDRGHAQQVKRVSFEKTSDELVVRVEGATDLALERRAIARKADMFEDLFGMRVRLTEATPAPTDKRTQSAID